MKNLPSLLLGTVVLTASVLSAQGPTALPVGTTIFTPSTAEHSFEHATGIPGNGFLPMMGGSQGDWDFGGSSGFALQGSPWGSPGGGDGSQTFVYLQGPQGSVSTTVPLPAGLWRIRYNVVRRTFQGPGSNNDFLFRVLVDHGGAQSTVDEYDSVSTGPDFEERLSSIFTVPVGGAANPTTLTFRNAFPQIAGQSNDKSNLVDVVTLERVVWRRVGHDETTPFNGNFEHTFPAGNPPFLNYGQDAALNPQQGPWLFGGSSGVVRAFQAFMTNVQHPPITVATRTTQPVGVVQAMKLPGSAPSGSKAAFMQGESASIEYTGTTPYPAGTYRLVYWAGTRNRNGGEDQAIEVELGGERIAAFRTNAEGDDPLTAEDVLGVPEFVLGAFREWTTRPFVLDGSTPLDLRFLNCPSVVGDRTVLLDDIRIERISAWSDPLTWSDDLGDVDNPATLPSALEDVQIPQNVSVGLDAASIGIRTLEVCGELLVPDVSFHLETANIMVRKPGALIEVGRAGAPFVAPSGHIELALRDDPDLAGAFIERRFMVMDSAEVDLHGGYVDSVTGDAEQHQSWTRLVADVTSGDTMIEIEGEHQWPGDAKILVVTSRGVNRPNIFADESEVLEIDQAVIVPAGGGNPAKTQLHLKPGVSPAFDHEGDFQATYTTPSGVNLDFDQRVEVGLLSRNLTISSETEGFSPMSTQPLALIGGDFMVMESVLCCESGHGGRARLSGAEFTSMGMTARLGRYPIHWHMLASEGDGQFARRCSIHHTFNRAITIHGTDSVLVKDNVIFENLGHAVFLEDGSEQDNVIKGNLTVRTVRPTADEAVEGPDMNPLTGDHLFITPPQNRSPSSYWITNPQNDIIDNVAAGSNATGFWFPFADGVIGDSKLHPELMDRVPNRIPFGAFSGNSAHSVMLAFDIGDGLRLGPHPQSMEGEGDVIPNVRYRPLVDGELVRQTLGPFTVWGSESALYSSQTNDALRFENIISVENRRGLDHARANTEVCHAVFVGSTNNPKTEPPQVAIYDAFTIYDGPAFLEDAHFIGYNFDDHRRSIIFLRGAHALHVNSTFKNVSFSDVLGVPQRRIEFPDYSNPTYTTPNDGQNPANPRKWGAAALSADATRTFMPPVAADPAYRTICTNNPWMIRGNQAPSGLPEIDWPVTNPLDASNAVITDAIFGYFNLRHLGVNPPNQPQAEMTRISRGGHYTDVSFTYDFTVDDHWAFPVITNEAVEYEVEWLTSLLSVPGYNGEVQFFVDEVPVDQAWASSVGPFETFFRFKAPTGANDARFQSLEKFRMEGAPVSEFAPLAGTGAVDESNVVVHNGSAFSINSAGTELFLKVVHTSDKREEFTLMLHQ